MEKYIALWSGGKDSCLAVFEGMKQGYHISYLLNFISEADQRDELHKTKPELIQLQAEVIGIPLVQKEWSRERSKGEKMVEEIKELVSNEGISGLIAGDISLTMHRLWVKILSMGLEVKLYLPFFGRDSEKVLASFIDQGFETIVVSTSKALLDKEWIGHKVDFQFIDYLRGRKIDIGGEFNEYHTFVVSGPIFKRKIRIEQAEIRESDMFWFLDIKKCKLD
jgi:uncharacterized protein (TIGR00290 family)